MANFTKQAIQSSFIKLLNEKPLKQISVRDIVDDCGINRNTFYYHYQDIPSLVESILKEETDYIVRENSNISSIEEGLNAVIRYYLQNKRAVLHIYKSVSRDLFEQYQWHICSYAVIKFLDPVLEERRICEEDRQVIFSYVRSLSFGVLIGWLESGLQSDILTFIHRLCELKQGELERMLDACRTVSP